MKTMYIGLAAGAVLVAAFVAGSMIDDDGETAPKGAYEAAPEPAAGAAEPEADPAGAAVGVPPE